MQTGPDAWVFRWYDKSNGERKYRKTVIGTVDRLPTRHAAEGAILAFRRNINSEHRVPETVSDLIPIIENTNSSRSERRLLRSRRPGFT